MPIWAIALLAAICLGVFAWMIAGFVLPFYDMTRATILEARLGPYGATEIDAMRGLLEKKPEARDLLISMHRGPDLILPLALTALLFSILLKLRPSGHFFHHPLSPAVIAAIYALPFLYGLSDYVENILTMNIFGGGPEWSFAAAVLPWASSLKFASFAISVIVILRFLAYRLAPPVDNDRG